MAQVSDLRQDLASIQLQSEPKQREELGPHGARMKLRDVCFGFFGSPGGVILGVRENPLETALKESS